MREAAASVCAAASWVEGSQGGGRKSRRRWRRRWRWRRCGGRWWRWRWSAAAHDDEFAHPCPVCLDNEDDATVDGKGCGQCFACGQMYCGACNANVSATLKYPTCRAPINISDACTWRLRLQQPTSRRLRVTFLLGQGKRRRSVTSLVDIGVCSQQLLHNLAET